MKKINSYRRRKLRKEMTRALIIAIAFLFFIFFAVGAYDFFIVTAAHSSFENYYSFRGCIELINRTADYGFCKIGNGQIIKIVKYQGKWYLDGDLPGWPF